MLVILVVLDFLLNLAFAGLEPHLPLFPSPIPNPLFFPLAREPLLSAPLLAPVETNFIFCSVFFLQEGQNLFVVFGNFIFFVDKIGLKRFLYLWSRSCLW